MNLPIELSILRLSDLHFTHKEMDGHNRPIGQFNQDVVVHSLLKYLKTPYSNREKPRYTLYLP